MAHAEASLRIGQAVLEKSSRSPLKGFAAMKKLCPGLLLLQLCLILCAGCSTVPSDVGSPNKNAPLQTIAIRVHRLDAMVAFYEEAFGVSFRTVETGAIQSQFGEVGDILIKLVPIREEIDFENYPSHQLGFRVADVQETIHLAVKHGGKQEGTILEEKHRTHGAIRDPDGNTIELYGPP